MPILLRLCSKLFKENTKLKYLEIFFFCKLTKNSFEKPRVFVFFFPLLHKYKHIFVGQDKKQAKIKSKTYQYDKGPQGISTFSCLCVFLLCSKLVFVVYTHFVYLLPLDTKTHTKKHHSLMSVRKFVVFFVKIYYYHFSLCNRLFPRIL